MKILDSVVVSVMVSESRIFRCAEFPEWMRLFWLLWAVVPTAVISVVKVFESIQADWQAGLSCIAGLFLSFTFLPSYAVG